MMALVLALAVPTSALAAGPGEGGDEAIEARLEIDTSGAGSGAEVLHRRIEERANVVLREAKILPGDRDDPLLSVTVREVGGDEPGYAASFELHASDGSLVDAAVEVECRLCTETELVARVEEEIDARTEALRELVLAEREPEVEPTPTPTPEPTPTDAPTRARAGMLAGGISLLAIGVVSLGAGVGLVIPEPRVDPDDPLDLITTRPVGYACLAGGVALAVTGAVLTAIAVERRRASLAIAPFGGRGQAGLMIGGRF